LAPFYQPSLLEDKVIITKVVNLYRKLVKPSDENEAPQATTPATISEASKVPDSPSNGSDDQQTAIEKSRQQCKDIPNAIARDHHNISRKKLSKNALKVLYRLQDEGYEAYLVGGCIRDILMGLTPKDFDVATNATPEQIKACFKNCRLIGRRFRLAHIVFGRELIEVATFRGHHQQTDNPATGGKKQLSAQSDEGQLLRDNVYGSIEEDAQRRDFTINALYYSVNGFYIRDFAGGIDAIKAKRIELIGDPQARYREDPVRMLRAIRFATKLNMTIEEKTEAPIYELGNLLSNIPPARLFEESMKLTLAGKALDNYMMMRKYDLFRHMFPVPYEVLDEDPDSKQEQLIRQVFINTDKRINANKGVTPAYIHAALLWYVVEKETQMQIETNGLSAYDASYVAMTEVLSRHCRAISLPKRFSTVSRDIWQLQHRLDRRMGKRAFKLMEHPKFRAGYDFLLLRGDIEGGKIAELAHWWTQFQDADDAGKQQMANDLNGSSNRGSSTGKYRNKNTTDDPNRNTSNNTNERRRGPRKNNRNRRKASNTATSNTTNSTATPPSESGQ